MVILIIVQTKASAKLLINLTLVGYLATVLRDQECQVVPGTKAPYIVFV